MPRVGRTAASRVRVRRRGGRSGARRRPASHHSRGREPAAKLRPPGRGLEPMAAKVDGLAAEAGVVRAPSLMLGPATLRDAFSYGVPGRYRIALPPAVAVRWRSARSSTRSCVTSSRTCDISTSPSHGWLARSGTRSLRCSRSRRGGADLRRHVVAPQLRLARRSTGARRPARLIRAAAVARARRRHPGGACVRRRGSVARVVSMVRDDAARPWYRRLLARHPRRISVSPHSSDRSSSPRSASSTASCRRYWRGSACRCSQRDDDAAHRVGARRAGHGGGGLRVAPLLAGSVGLGLARAALVARVAGERVRPASVAPASPPDCCSGSRCRWPTRRRRDRRTGRSGGWSPWASSRRQRRALCGLAELWADAAPAFRRRGARGSAHGRRDLALRRGPVVRLTLEIGARAGWTVTREWLVFAAFPTLVVVAAVVAAAGAAWALWASRREAMTPDWLLERGTPEPWPKTGSVGPRGGAVAGQRPARSAWPDRSSCGPSAGPAESIVDGSIDSRCWSGTVRCGGAVTVALIAA